MKRFSFWTTTLVALALLFPAGAWAPPPGAVVVREGANIGPANTKYGLIIGAKTLANAPAYITSVGDIATRGPFEDVRTYASFSSAITSIGPTKTTLLIPEEQSVTTDVTVPTTMELMFTRNGVLSIDTGKTVTINGPLDAGLHQIYAGSGTVAFGSGYIKEVYPQWWGAVGDGATDSSVAVQAAVDAMPDYSTLYFSNGVFVAASILFENMIGIKVLSDNAKIIQPVESTDARSVTRKTFHFKTSTNITVSGIEFAGNQLHANAGDNNVESAISFDGVTDGVIKNNIARNFQYAFIVTGSSERILIDNNIADTTFTGFLVGSSSKVLVSNNISYGAHYAPAGTNDDKKGAGYGFLSDQSTYVTFQNNISEQSGSDGFRAQHSTESSTHIIFDNNKSINPRRNGYSLRTSVGLSTISNSSVAGIGDTSIWDGTAYFVPYSSNLTGMSISATGNKNKLKGNTVNGGITDTYGILIADTTSNLKIVDNEIEVPGWGIILQGSKTYNKLLVADNTVKITSTADVYYGIELLGTLPNSRVTNNSVEGGWDGLLSYTSGSVIADNTFLSQERHGINLLGQRNIVQNNNIENPGQSETGAGIYVNASNNIIGANVISDTQGTTTMYRTLWVGTSGTNTIVGPIIQFVSSLANRLDVAVTWWDASSVYINAIPFASQSSEASTTDGTVANANGSGWNPGGGAGLHLYDGTQWQKLSPGGTIPVMTSTDATPTVLGMKYLRSLGTTTITDFDDGFEGQVITFIAETSITITDGTNIFLSGSANWAMTATDTLTLLQKADGKWYEIGRGDNGA